MSRRKPVFGSSGKSCARCRPWFPWGDYRRDYKQGYVDRCSKCLANAEASDGGPREAFGRGTERLGGAGSYPVTFSPERDVRE